jgi:peroxiredoxin
MEEEKREELPIKEESGPGGRLIRYLVWGPLLVLCVVIVAALLTREGNIEGRRLRPKIGEPARDFTYPDLNDVPVTLSDFYGDKVVVINIWATWCTSCRKELPTLQAMYQRLKGEDLEVLAVSIDALGKKAIVPFMKELGLTFPALQNPSGDIQQLYGTTGVPESFMIDKGGKIALVEVGAGDWSTPKRIAFVKNLMSEPDGAQ